MRALLNKQQFNICSENLLQDLFNRSCFEALRQRKTNRRKVLEMEGAEQVSESGGMFIFTGTRLSIT